MSDMESARRLVLVLGDQLDAESAAFDGFDAQRDAVWMAEVAREATHVWCHKKRIALFLSAMRHFRDRLRDRDVAVCYTEMSRRPPDDRGGAFGDALRRDVRRLRPAKLIVVRPGDWRVLQELRDAAEALGTELEVRADRHFYCSVEHFDEWAAGRKSMLLEHFYRHMRKREGVLMAEGGQPVGGRWNFDHDNRRTLGRAGPPRIEPPQRFGPDPTTREVLDLVAHRFADHPGRLDGFDLPVTRPDALSMLREFIEHRLPSFGAYQDAMHTGEPLLYHSRLSAPLNLKLISPRECVDAAVAAHENGHAPLNSVEGFVRQLLGWREFIRGVYWRFMPDYIDENALGCDDRDVPSSFWDGRTQMNCVAESMRHVLEHGYAHHIHRLMVFGLLAMQLGVHPRRFHDWHMAMYLDAVDWVSLPNTLGMSQFGDGGIVGTKPYAASGKYIDRMSDFCRGCVYDPKKATGADACPITVLYWDFLDRHAERFRGNQRMRFQLHNLQRKPEAERRAIRVRAEELRREFT